MYQYINTRSYVVYISSSKEGVTKSVHNWCTFLLQDPLTILREGRPGNACDRENAPNCAHVQQHPPIWLRVVSRLADCTPITNYRRRTAKSQTRTIELQRTPQARIKDCRMINN